MLAQVIEFLPVRWEGWPSSQLSPLVLAQLWLSWALEEIA